VKDDQTEITLFIETFQNFNNLFVFQF